MDEIGQVKLALAGTTLLVVLVTVALATLWYCGIRLLDFTLDGGERSGKRFMKKIQARERGEPEPKEWYEVAQELLKRIIQWFDITVLKVTNYLEQYSEYLKENSRTGTIVSGIGSGFWDNWEYQKRRKDLAKKHRHKSVSEECDDDDIV